MMRLLDYRCDWCGVEQEIVHLKGEQNETPSHCGYEMRKMIGAPMVFYKPHYSHALGRHVNRYSDEEKELAKKGQWIASKDEASRLYDHDLGDNAVIKPVDQQRQKEEIRKTVEQTAQKLVADGVIPGSSEW